MARRINLERSFESFAAAPLLSDVPTDRHYPDNFIARLYQDYADKFRVLLDADDLFESSENLDNAVLTWANSGGWKGVQVCAPQEVHGMGNQAQLRLVDLDKQSAQAHALNYALAVDISGYTPALIRPLRHGADAVLCCPYAQMIPLRLPMNEVLIGWRSREHPHTTHRTSLSQEKVENPASVRPFGENSADQERGIVGQAQAVTMSVDPCAPESIGVDAIKMIEPLLPASQFNETNPSSESEVLGEATARAMIDLSCATMTMRMQARSTHALALARYFDAHPAVDQVSYSGLSDHLDHHQAHGIFVQGYGPVLLICLHTSPAHLAQLFKNTSFVFVGQNQHDILAAGHPLCLSAETGSFGQDSLMAVSKLSSSHATRVSHQVSSYLTRVIHLASHSTDTNQVLLVEPGFESVPDVVHAWEGLLDRLDIDSV